MVTQTPEVMQQEIDKLRTKFKKLNEWLSAEELRAARSMNMNVDYWQARLDTTSQIKDKIKQF